jgi:hypothetical protein
MRDVDMPAVPGPIRPAPSFEPGRAESLPNSAPFVDSVVQRQASPQVTPGPLVTFEGINNAHNLALHGGFVFLPPDTTGDVGPSHYVEMVNQAWSVYSKTGVVAAGFPKSNAALWSGFANPECATVPRGDPIVMYDKVADRWFLTEFAFPLTGTPPTPDDPFTQCIAVSTTPDPTGSYFRYAYVFPTNMFNDYGKFGVWPDAYYASYNMFTMPAGTFATTTVAAYDRAAMLSGAPSPATITFDVAQGSLLPSDMDGTISPPVGAPNYFVRRADIGGSGSDALRLWKFHVDFVTPGLSTFTGPTSIPVADFDSIMSDIPQPAGGVLLDTLADRVMQRLAYRNFVTHESLVVNHAADVSTDHAGIRWYEIRDPGGSPFLHQQATWAPDANHRWMGSMAMDCNGNLALGYSVSSASVPPSIRYAGRLVTDPLSTLQTEATLFAGIGSQLSGVFSDPSRWGDYTAMQVDPSDDRTFWYTNEYYPPDLGPGSAQDNRYNWHTRIGSFRLSDTGCPVPTGVNVSSFSARAGKGGVTLSWRTSSEVELAGFNLWRASGGKTSWRKVNGALVAAKRAGQARGASYRFVDRTAKNGRFYNYRLQVVDLKGKRGWYGIGTVPIR